MPEHLAILKAAVAIVASLLITVNFNGVQYELKTGVISSVLLKNTGWR